MSSLVVGRVKTCLTGLIIDPTLCQTVQRGVVLNKKEVIRRWKPIHTAPQDGTQILLLVRPEDSDPNVIDANPMRDEEVVVTIGHYNHNDDEADTWHILNRWRIVRVVLPCKVIP